MALPVDLAVVTVNGTLLFTDGSPVGTTATVTFTPTGTLFRDPGDALIASRAVVCTVNASGQIVGPTSAVGAGGIGVKLPATDDTDYVPTGSAYAVTIVIPNAAAIPTFQVQLPSSPATVDLSDLTPVVDLPQTGAPITQLQADARYQRYFAPVTVSVDGSGNINTDASVSSVVRCTLGQNAALANPTNPTDGQKVEWQLKQDVTGGRTLTLGSKFRLNADVGSVTLSTGAGKMDSIVAQYHLGDDKWDVLGLVKGA
jgi:hypothetical protein